MNKSSENNEFGMKLGTIPLSHKKQSHFLIITILIGCLSIGFMLFSISEPITYDELWQFSGGTSILSTGRPLAWTGGYDLGHPPLYAYLLALSFKLFGVSEVAGRLIGVLGAIGTAFLIYWVARLLLCNYEYRDRVGCVACVLYLVNPAVIQGALIFDIDCSILPFFSMALIACFIWAAQRGDIRHFMAFGFLFCVALWAKLTTPVITVGVIWIYSLFDPQARGKSRHLILSVIAGVIGFLISWGVYAYLKDVPFLYPFDYLAKSFVSKQIQGSSWELFLLIVRALVRLALWWSPPLLVLSLLAIAKRTRILWSERKLLLWDLLILYTLAGLIGYIWIGGVTFGFPKYHAPILPVLSLLVAAYVVPIAGILTKRHLLILGVMTLGAILYWGFLIGDPLLTFNFALRDAIIHQPLRVNHVLGYFLCQELLCLLLLVIIVVTLRVWLKLYDWYRSLVVGLMVVTLSASVAMNVFQAKADYLTRFCYGDQGTEQLLVFLKTHAAQGDVVVACRDIVFYMDNNSPYRSDKLWYSWEQFVRVIQRPEVRYVVYSVGHNSIQQYRATFFHPTVEKTLSSDFLRSQIGTYTIWTRR